MTAECLLLFNKRSKREASYGKRPLALVEPFHCLPHVDVLPLFCLQSSVVLAKANEFTHILRIQNTNVDGKRKVMFALRAIRGIGRRFSNLVLKIAQIDLNKRYVAFDHVTSNLNLLSLYRAGEMTEQDIEKINDIIAKPTGKNPRLPPAHRYENFFLKRLLTDEFSYRLQHSQVVLEQTERYQRRKLVSTHFQSVGY